MRDMKGKAATLLAALVLAMQAGGARAGEVKVLSSFGMQAVLEEMKPRFERATGHKLAITFTTLGGTAKRLQQGETFDVVIALERGIQGFIKEGHAVAATEHPIARTGMGVAVRAGAPKPDISSPEAFKNALLNAKSITYTNPATGGASGIYFSKVLDRLGIADEMKPKTVFLSRAGPVGDLVADGKAELVVQPFQLLASIPGIEIVGPLPGDLQDTEVFVAAVTNRASDVSAASMLIRFLRSPESAEVIKAKGMEPS
jgi:molybdate transport system substrate-binding protein